MTEGERLDGFLRGLSYRGMAVPGSIDGAPYKRIPCSGFSEGVEFSSWDDLCTPWHATKGRHIHVSLVPKVMIILYYIH